MRVIENMNMLSCLHTCMEVSFLAWILSYSSSETHCPYRVIPIYNTVVVTISYCLHTSEDIPKFINARRYRFAYIFLSLVFHKFTICIVLGIKSTHPANFISLGTSVVKIWCLTKFGGSLTPTHFTPPKRFTISQNECYKWVFRPWM